MIRCLLFFYLVFINLSFAVDLFDEKRVVNAPIFQNNNKGVIYFGASAGGIIFNSMNFYNLHSIKMSLAPIFTITAGYKSTTSSFRHELNFSYLDFNSKTINYNYFNNTYDLKSNVMKYYFIYNLYYNSDNLLNSKKNSVQFFIGPGVGFVLNKVSISANSNELIKYINSFNDTNGFGFAYEGSVGLAIKLSELWIGQIKARYIIDNGNFKNPISKINSQMFVLEIGAIFKAL